MTVACILGQAAPAGTSPQPMLAHQPFDAMQSGIQTFGQNVVPHTTCAIGPIAAGEAGPDPSQQNVILPGTPARRAIEPGVEARP
jgi:hypothetical protein